MVMAAAKLQQSPAKLYNRVQHALQEFSFDRQDLNSLCSDSGTSENTACTGTESLGPRKTKKR